jgi:uncharacterized protein
MRALLSALAVPLVLFTGAASARGEELPPAPAAYFNDYAGIVSGENAKRLDEKLRRFAAETSTQVVVAVFKSLPSQSLEDFTLHAAEKWRVGRKDWDNGAVLFVFVDDRKMRIETGYGLEGALPDQLAARILDQQVRPRFRAGDWTGGLEAGIDGIIAATRGEYKAPAKPEASGGVPLVAGLVVLGVFVVFFILVIWLASQGAQHLPAGRTYDRRGPRRDGSYWGGGSWGGGGWSGGGGGLGGGGFSGGGGGGFSGGGGSFGGGGASSSW